jgi:hypothetical protein
VCCLVWWLSVWLSWSGAAPLPCTLALKLDSSAYLLSTTEFNELDYDQASFDDAACQETRLDAELAGQPRLKARMDELRDIYADLSSLECSLGRRMEGGGTFFTHALVRRLPELEKALRGVAALASGRAGAVSGARFTESIQTSRRAVSERIAALKR